MTATTAVEAVVRRAGKGGGACAVGLVTPVRSLRGGRAGHFSSSLNAPPDLACPVRRIVPAELRLTEFDESVLATPAVLIEGNEVRKVSFTLRAGRVEGGGGGGGGGGGRRFLTSTLV